MQEENTERKRSGISVSVFYTDFIRTVLGSLTVMFTESACGYITYSTHVESEYN